MGEISTRLIIGLEHSCTGMPYVCIVSYLYEFIFAEDLFLGVP